MRFDAGELQELDFMAGKSGLNRSEIVRAAVRLIALQPHLLFRNADAPAELLREAEDLEAAHFATDHPGTR